MIELETERLLIRDNMKEDLTNLHKLLSDREVMRLIPEIYCGSMEKSETNLNLSMEEASKKNRRKFYFAILEKSQKDTWVRLVSQ